MLERRFSHRFLRPFPLQSTGISTNYLCSETPPIPSHFVQALWWSTAELYATRLNKNAALSGVELDLESLDDVLSWGTTRTARSLLDLRRAFSWIVRSDVASAFNQSLDELLTGSSSFVKPVLPVVRIRDTFSSCFSSFIRVEGSLLSKSWIDRSSERIRIGRFCAVER